ncbi:hypothetical protein BDB01DRAFT_838017 [Pilobolus umbonatus]|nr:hypothetical protein BDB01DRAFT_838017 [Pilobolus umbonatus]
MDRGFLSECIHGDGYLAIANLRVRCNLSFKSKKNGRLLPVSLGNNNLISDNDYDEIQCIELPVTSLKLDRSDVGNCEWSIVVVKTVEGVWIKSWHYCSQRKGMIVSDGPLTKYDLGQLMGGIIYVFECSLVEDVVFGP